MADKTPEDSKQELLNIVGAHPNGIATPDIAEQLPDTLPRRTLQYRLKQLVANGRLRAEGTGRWTRYYPVTENSPQRTSIRPVDKEYSQLITLSDGGYMVRDYVRQPLAARNPVGYNRDFLEQYQPNSTFYLTQEERENLRKLGELQTVDQPAGTYAKHILDRLLIDLAWNSSRLEGNTYSLLDTKRLIEFGEEATGRAHIEAQMILNHKDAIEFLVGTAAETEFNRYTLLNLHALLSNNLLADPAASGRLRFIAVGIDQSVFHPLETPQLIEECFALLLSKAAEIEDSFEQAFFVMVHIPYLQPFDDVNKRVSRLAANIPLIRHNLAPLSFTDVPQQAYTEAVLGVYKLNDIALLKDVFFWAYERSAVKYAAVRQSLGEPDPFRLKYRDELREIIATLIRAGIGRRNAASAISEWTVNRISREDRDKFTEIVEAELLGLHEGNFARYRVRPSEFAAWQKGWKSRA